MPSTDRWSSEYRFDPEPSRSSTSTLHLSPTRSRMSRSWQVGWLPRIGSRTLVFGRRVKLPSSVMQQASTRLSVRTRSNQRTERPVMVDLDLAAPPARPGRRPVTTGRMIPHDQLEQFSPPEIRAELIEAAKSLPGVFT